MPKALTRIKFHGAYIAPGEEIDRASFTEEQWVALLEAGAVEPSEALQVAEEVDESVPVESEKEEEAPQAEGVGQLTASIKEVT
jgi:hypothetical protein